MRAKSVLCIHIGGVFACFLTVPPLQRLLFLPLHGSIRGATVAAVGLFRIKEEEQGL